MQVDCDILKNNHQCFLSCLFLPCFVFPSIFFFLFSLVFPVLFLLCINDLLLFLVHGTTKSNFFFIYSLFKSVSNQGYTFCYCFQVYPCLMLDGFSPCLNVRRILLYQFSRYLVQTFSLHWRYQVVFKIMTIPSLLHSLLHKKVCTC